MTPRALVLYATREQQTAKIAARITEILRARGQSVELSDADRRPSNLYLSLFDGVIVAAPVHAGGYPKSILRFARANASRLDTMPNAFCSVGLAIASRTSDGRAETQTVVDRFVHRTGWRPKRVEMAAGALPYTRYNPFFRFIMRRISAAAWGDVDTSRITSTRIGRHLIALPPR
jgi:menaquinone-dependent protoporphyrinogen oxidase